MSGDDKYDGRGENSAQAIAQAHVYRQITGRSYHDREQHLWNASVICETLGLDRVVDHTTFSVSWRRQFGHCQEYLEKYCKWIIDELREIGLNEFDAYLPGDTSSRETKHYPEIPDIEIDQMIEHVRDIILGTTDFDRNPNTMYDADEILDIGLDSVRERDTFNAVIKDDGPALKTVMNAIKNRGEESWQEEFETVNRRILSAAKGTGMLDRPVEGHDDITLIPIYPQNADLPDGARGNDKKRGTY